MQHPRQKFEGIFSGTLGSFDILNKRKWAPWPERHKAGAVKLMPIISANAAAVQPGTKR